jgi:hypothetical protein
MADQTAAQSAESLSAKAHDLIAAIDDHQQQHGGGPESTSSSQADGGGPFEVPSRPVAGGGPFERVKNALGEFRDFLRGA